MLVKRPTKDLGTCARDGLHTFPIAFGREWRRSVPHAIELEIEQVGGLRRWLDLHAAVCAVGYGENPVRRLERA